MSTCTVDGVDGCGQVGGVNTQSDTDKEYITDDGCGQVGVVTNQSDTDKKSLKNKREERQTVHEDSPLSLLSDVPSTIIDSSDVSLSDLEEGKKGGKRKEGINSSDSTCSVENGEEPKQITRKRLSLKSKKSWRLKHSDYGIEKKEESEELMEAGSDTGSSSSNKDGKPKSSLKKKSNIENRSRDKDGYRSPSDTKKESKKNTLKDDAAIITRRKKKVKRIFSSDEDGGCYDNLGSLLTSSEDELKVSEQLENVKNESNNMKLAKFHLTHASSDDSMEDVSAPSKKKKSRMAINSSSSSSSESNAKLTHHIIIDSSSDDFEERKTFRLQSVVNNLKKRKRKQRRRNRLSSHDTTSSDGGLQTTPVKNEESTDEDNLTPGTIQYY